jgi:hypothetical protein
MRTFFYLIITSFIATGAMFAGLNQHQPLIGYAIGVGSWAWFFWCWHKRQNRRRRF